MTATRAWQVAVATEADRLAAQLARATKASGAESAGGGPAGIAQAAIARARAAATAPPSRSIRDWWSGTGIETAWQSLHLASEQIMLMMPADEVKAHMPYLLGGLAWMPPAAQLAGGASLAGPPDPLVAQRALAAHHTSTDARHQQIRGMRNVSVLLLAALVVIDCALWAAGVTSGTVVGLGALAGALSVVFAMRSPSPPGPYSVLPAQCGLKIAGGAATALMAVKILDFVSGEPGNIARDSMYAVVFGFSQQAFTRLVDEQAGTLARKTPPRSALPAVPVPPVTPPAE